MTTNKDGRMTERAVEAFLDLAADKFSVNMRDVSFTREWIKATLRPALQDLMVSLLSAPAAPRERETLKRAEQILYRFAMVGKLALFYVEEAIPEPSFPADGVRLDPDGPSPVTLGIRDFTEALEVWNAIRALAPSTSIKEKP